MIASLMVCVKSNRHEIAELGCKPVIEQIRMCSDQVPADEDVENSSNKGKLLSCCYSPCVMPSSAKTVDRLLHTLTVFFELFVRRR